MLFMLLAYYYKFAQRITQMKQLAFIFSGGKPIPAESKTDIYQTSSAPLETVQ